MQNDEIYLRQDQPARYQIQVLGRLTSRWADWVEGMQVQVEESASGQPTTTLTGCVADQAALLGLLQRLYTLGFPLVTVTLLEAQSAKQAN